MEKEQRTCYTVFEDKKPDPRKVFDGLKEWSDIAHPRFGSIYDRAMARLAQRNNIPYQRMTKDPTFWGKVTSFFLNVTDDDLR